MPILQDFCQAFEQAIVQYETEWNGKISTDRQNQIRDLRTYLNQCQNPSPNQPISTALTVRQEMIERVKNIPFEFGEFFLPGIRLSTALRQVLELPRFSDIPLMNAQFSETQMLHRDEISILRNQINTLTQQVEFLSEELKKEKSKDSVQRVNQLIEELAKQQEVNTYLISVNSQLRESFVSESAKLQKEYENLQVSYENLLKDYQIVKKERDALRAEQEKTSANTSQDQKSNYYFPPSPN